MSIIAISRQYGSGGSEVAASLAHELGWTLLDNDIIDEVARQTGLPSDEVAAREERQASLAERLADAMAMSTQEPLPLANANFPPSDEKLLDAMRHVIEAAASRGPVVVVGRGAQEILGSYDDDLLSVFCYSPRHALVARTMQQDRLTQQAAEKRVDAINRQRAAWVKAHWGRQWSSMEPYDLCVNTYKLGIPGAVQTIASVARRTFGL